MMSIRYDEKGKYFTPIVSKDPVQVTIQTLVHRIQGNVYTRPDERIKDAMNNEDMFLAVTDGSVFNSHGELIYQSDFLLVNIDQIVWVLPIEDDENE
jgi:hypothetical protein